MHKQNLSISVFFLPEWLAIKEYSIFPWSFLARGSSWYFKKCHVREGSGQDGRVEGHRVHISS